MAQLLGYGDKDDYEPLYAQLADIESRTEDGKSGQGFFDRIRSSMSNLCNSVFSYVTATAPAIRALSSFNLSGEPAENAAGKQSVNKPVHHRLRGVRPRPAEPDTVWNGTNAVSDERNGPCDTEYLQIIGIRPGRRS